LEDGLSRRHKGTELRENEIGTVVIDCAVELPRQHRGVHVERQVSVAIEYQVEKVDEAFRADLVVEGKVIVELKSVERVTPAHKKQLLTSLRLTRLKLGYLLNFGEALMREGITRTIQRKSASSC
jgi:GxxExxY protein